MVDQSQTPSSLERYTGNAWQAVGSSWVLLFVGGGVIRAGGQAAFLSALGAWFLGICAGGVALVVVGVRGVTAQSKIKIVVLAVLGMVVNAIPPVLLAMLVYGLQGIGR
jgi:hypothetical protein